MAIVRKVAGYSLGQADLLRKAMGKKKKEILDKEKVPYTEGMKANGFSASAIEALWNALLPFSDYAFNKAHSAAYGLVSYWTAYLKANYPAEYMAALLTSVKDDKDKMAIYLNECRRMKIQVLPPDVNESSSNFTPVMTDIRFGLTAIRNVGHNVVSAVVDARQEKGRFADFNDFMDKVPALVCNKRVIESLVKAGAFDEMKHKRRALVAIHEAAVDQYVDIKRNEAIGQDSLFGAFDGLDGPGSSFGISVTVPDLDEWDKTTLLGHEREMLGLYVSDHPLLGLEHVLSVGTDATIGQLLLDEERPDNSPVTICGLVTSVQRKITKKGDSWAIVTVEDLDGGIEVMMWPSVYQLASTYLVEDAIITVRGFLSREKDHADDQGAGGHHPRPQRRPQRARRDQPAVDAVHAAGGRAAQGGAEHPPGPDRGAAQAPGPHLHHRAPTRRAAPGDPDPRPVRRPQAAARSRMSERVTGERPVAPPRTAERRVPLVQVALIVATYVVVGARRRVAVVRPVGAGDRGGGPAPVVPRRRRPAA